MLPELVSRRSNCNLRLGRLAEIGCKCQVESRALEHRLFCFSWLHLRAVPFRAPQLPCCESQPGEHTYIWMCLFVIIHTLVSKIWWSFLKSLSWILLCLIILAYIDRWFHRNTFRSCIASGHACWLLTLLFSELKETVYSEWKLFWVSLLTDASILLLLLPNSLPPI